MSMQDDSGRAVRRASRLPYVGALAFMGVTVVAAWVGRDRLQPVTAGSAAPSFAATNMEGREVRLEDYRGKVLLVNVWATWCPPCREEMPSMERLYQEIRAEPGGEDFEILAVSVDASTSRPDPLGRGVERSELVEFAEEFDLTFPVFHDPAGRIQDLYHTIGVPESFVIGRDGVIYKKVTGATVWDSPQYVELIRRLLGL